MVNGKSNIVTVREQVFYANKLVVPEAPWLQWISTNPNSDVNYYMSVHQVAASASDEAILVDDDTNTVYTAFFDTEGAVATDLTIKINGATDGRAVKPLMEITEPLTSLTVSNSNSDDAKQLLILRVVVSDTTNTELKEVEG